MPAVTRRVLLGALQRHMSAIGKSGPRRMDDEILDNCFDRMMPAVFGPPVQAGNFGGPSWFIGWYGGNYYYAARYLCAYGEDGSSSYPRISGQNDVSYQGIKVEKGYARVCRKTVECRKNYREGKGCE